MPSRARRGTAMVAVVRAGAVARRGLLRGGAEAAGAAALAGLALTFSRAFGAPAPFPVRAAARPPQAADGGTNPAPSDGGSPAEFHFIGASPAQAVLFVAPPHAVMIGAGSAETGRAVLSILSAGGIPRLRAIWVTGGRPGGGGALTAVLQSLPVGEMRDAGPDLPGEVAALARQRRVPMRRAARGDVLQVGGGRFLWVWPPASLGQPETPAAAGGAVQALVGHVRFLLAGGLPAGEEDPIVRMGGDLAAQVLEVPGGGASSVLDPAFLRAVGPKVAVVADSPERAALPEVVDQLGGAGALVVHSQSGADLTLGTNGRRIAVAFDPGPAVALAPPEETFQGSAAVR